jgi:hypothetical protein
LITCACGRNPDPVRWLLREFWGAAPFPDTGISPQGGDFAHERPRELFPWWIAHRDNARGWLREFGASLLSVGAKGFPANS